MHPIHIHEKEEAIVKRRAAGCHYTYVRRRKGQGHGSHMPKCAGLEGESGQQSQNML